jgi:D-alanyl-D-alanine carboxypeptidase.
MVTKKDIIAGIINADHAKPYESVRTNIDGSLALGRYGMNFQLLDYFMDELGEPPNEAMLSKLPKSLRDKLGTKEGRAAFREFASKLKAGGGADPKNQEFMKEFAQVLPKDSQEAIADAIIEKAGPKLGDDNTKLAFMFQTGQRPDQLTAANFEQPEFKQMETAVKRLGEMAETRQHTKEDQHITWDSHGKVGVGHGRWLSGEAGTSFNAAQAEARLHGREIKVNSAGRSHDEQWALYRELKPRGGRVAYPGTSNHEKGNAIDVANYNDPVIRQILAKHGFEWGDGRGPMNDDLVHFKYTGRNRTYNA